MKHLRVEKSTLDYIKKDFDNLLIQILSEDDRYFYYSYNETELLSLNDIENEPGYDSDVNIYPVIELTAKRKFEQVRAILNDSGISDAHKENLYFMLLYIKAGIDIHPEWRMVNHIHSANLSNYIIAKRLTRGGLDDVQIVIKSKNKGEAIFDNLDWSGALLNNVMDAIFASIPGINTDSELVGILNNPDTSDSKLTFLARKHNSYAEEPRHYLIIKAASTLISYLNDNRLLYKEKAKLGSKPQLELIYDLFEIIGFVKPKFEVEGDHIKRYREKIRDTLYK